MNSSVSWSFSSRIRTILRQHGSEFISAAILLLMTLNLLAVISRKTLTNDEKYHIPAGYYHLVFGDFQLNPEHPPLVKMLAALPLVLIQPEAPAAGVDPNESVILLGHDAFQAFWDANPDKLQLISFWARVPMVVITIAFGVVLFLYGRYLAGGKAGALAVALFSVEPTILAHGRIVQTDVPAAFAYLVFFFSLQRLIDTPNTRRIIELGLTAGIALVVKFSLVIILPVFALALVVIGWRQYRAGIKLRNLALQAGLAAAALLLIVNLAYYFKRPPLLPANEQAIVQQWPEHADSATRAFQFGSKVVPSMYLFGFFVVTVHNEWGHYASLLGKHSRTGWWYYFPVAFALKTTVPFLLLSLCALIWAIWRLAYREKGLLLPLLAIALYTAISMNSRINIGVRHFLPVFPFLFLLGGVFLGRLLEGKYQRFVRGLVVVLFFWMTIEAVRTFPDYIPYMNQFASSKPHWYYLSDSNVEWGDDTAALARYLQARGETKVRAAVLGGWMSSVQYGVEYVNPMVVDQHVEQTRYIAIGASYLNGSTVPLMRYQNGKPITEDERHNFFASYRDREPEASFGRSIYLFREFD